MVGLKDGTLVDLVGLTDKETVGTLLGVLVGFTDGRAG